MRRNAAVYVPRLPLFSSVPAGHTVGVSECVRQHVRQAGGGVVAPRQHMFPAGGVLKSTVRLPCVWAGAHSSSIVSEKHRIDRQTETVLPSYVTLQF